MRGRKIKINYTEPNGLNDLELTQDGETPSGAPVEQTLNRPFNEPSNQIVAIDGETLTFQHSISFECIPGNIEVLLHDNYFTETQSFSRRLTPELQQDLIIKEVLEKIWEKHDTNRDGVLQKTEARQFL